MNCCSNVIGLTTAMIATMCQYGWQLAFFDWWIAHDGNLYALPGRSSNDDTFGFIKYVLRTDRIAIWTDASSRYYGEGLIAPSTHRHLPAPHHLDRWSQRYA